MAAVNTFAARVKITASVQKSLLAKLSDAKQALDRGNLTVARNKLEDVIASPVNVPEAVQYRSVFQPLPCVPNVPVKVPLSCEIAIHIPARRPPSPGHRGKLLGWQSRRGGRTGARSDGGKSRRHGASDPAARHSQHNRRNHGEEPDARRHVPMAGCNAGTASIHFRRMIMFIRAPLPLQ
jgi:hypothetical protein